MIPSSVCPSWQPEHAADAAQERRSYTTSWGTILARSGARRTGHARCAIASARHRRSASRESEVQAALCPPGVLELGTEAAALDRLRIALQHLKLRLLAVAPEPDIESVGADTKIEHRQIGQPRLQQTIEA